MRRREPACRAPAWLRRQAARVRCSPAVDIAITRDAAGMRCSRAELGEGKVAGDDGRLRVVIAGAVTQLALIV
jgi:hypothetical protein